VFSQLSHSGFLSSTARITLLLVISLSACVAVPAAQFSLSPTVVFEGSVDGSAGADVGGGFFVGATDEDNKFRLYDVKGGPSLKTLDVGVKRLLRARLSWKRLGNATSRVRLKLEISSSGSVRTDETNMRRRRKSGRSCSQPNLVALAKTRSWRLQERFTHT